MHLLIVGMAFSLVFCPKLAAQKRGAKPMTKEKDELAIHFKVGAESFEMPFVRIPAGMFTMGTSKAAFAEVKKKQDLLQDGDEEQHEVELSEFHMGTFHVTRGQFALFVKDAGYKTEIEQGGGGDGWNETIDKLDYGKKYSWKYTGFAQTDDRPVVNVSWNDAKKFCSWMSKKCGKKIAMPTEAQWEYACRAGSKTLFYFGDDPEELVRYANVADASFRKATGISIGAKGDDGYAFTSPVGRFKPNKFGLYDMHGNAMQWCEDYKGEYKDVPKKKDPVRAVESTLRVLRGGAWWHEPLACRSAIRYGDLPDSGDCFTSFRVVMLR